MSDDIEQTPPSTWTEKGGMAPQQESANNWAKEILESAHAHEQAAKEKAQERVQDMGR